VRNSHPRRIRSKVHVVPNPVDLNSFAHVPQKLPAAPPVLLCVGRFMEEKNQAALIQAFARVAHAFPSWRLKLVGEGGQRTVLESEVKRLGLTDRVLMPGVASEIATEYALASLVAIPSLYESFGLVAAEALACARPVIAFDDCEGVAGIVRNGVNGVLVPARGDRVANLADALRVLMGDQSLRARLGASGPGSVAHLGREDVLDRWERLFLSLQYGERHG
jgi:glycosyltransferase involved in cell wall biosynthesis